jgi:hypothetical protein
MGTHTISREEIACVRLRGDASVLAARARYAARSLRQIRRSRQAPLANYALFTFSAIQSAM